MCLPAIGTAQQSARTESCTLGAKETLDDWVGCYSLAVTMSCQLIAIYDGVDVFEWTVGLNKNV